MIVCKNCGGAYADNLSYCPYCGSINKKTAYAKFREKISNIIDNVLGLKKQADRSISRIIFSSILRGLVIVLLCLALAFGLSIFRNTNYYNDKEYDEKRLKDIIWENENISKLDEAYLNGDYDIVEKLVSENNSVTYNWQYFNSFQLNKVYKELVEKEINEDFSEYTFAQCLYYLYYPDYFVFTERMSLEQLQEYENKRRVIIDMLVKKGYSESQLQNIYDNNADEYGYLSITKLKEFIIGGPNG